MRSRSRSRRRERLLEQARLLHGALDDGRERLEVERLGEVVVGALLDGRDGARDGAEGGHHHEDASAATRSCAFSMKAMPSRPGHLEVGEDDVGGELLELAEGLEAVGGGLGRVALVAQDLGERGARVGLVVDDEDPAARTHDGPVLAVGSGRGSRTVPDPYRDTTG